MKQHTFTIFAALLFVGLGGCGPSPEKVAAINASETAAASSQTPRPTATATLTPTTTATSIPTNTPMPSPTPHTTILIWKVGSPHKGDTPAIFIPLDFLMAGRELGYRFVIETFPAKDFAQRFVEAQQDNEEPDILAFGNFGIISGITTSLGNFAGIGTDSLVFVSDSFKSLAGEVGGWQVLVTTSQHYEEVKSLALSEVACDSRLNSKTPAGVNETELTQMAGDIIDAYHGTDIELDQYLTSTAIISASGRHNRVERLRWTEGEATHTNICAIMGNEKLVFIYAVTTFDTPKYLGRHNILLVMQWDQGDWRVVTISNDIVTTREIYDSIPKLVDLLVCPPTDTIDALQPAILLSPANGGYPLPTGGDRFGYFEWQPSPSSNIAAEVVEFSVQGTS